MKLFYSLLVILFVCFNLSYAQMPMEEYRAEIESLNSERKINEYWNKLYKIDQEILVHTNDVKIADSISISNMIRTALIFDIHGIEAYKPNNVLPILNLSHNNIGQSLIAYWPIITTCAEVGGTIESFGGPYPAYELEGISLTFYNYSLFNQESRYADLLNTLNQMKRTNSIDGLLKSFKNQNKLHELSEVKVLHVWHRQSFKERIDDGTFSFVEMSDGQLYLKNFGRIKKLIPLDSNPESHTFRIEHEPFGWTFVYGKDGSLKLIDEEQQVLIQYTLVN